jgi:hypothetical protein
VLYLLAASTCRSLESSTRFAPVFQRSALVAIAHPLLATGVAPSFAALASDEGQVVMEALRGMLASHLVNVDRERRQGGTGFAALDPSQGLGAGVGRYVRDVIARDRPDLGYFVLDASNVLMDARAARGPSFFAVDTPKLSLSERTRLVRGLMPLFETALEYRGVAARARATGFVDDGYDGAQAILHELEPWTTDGFDRLDTVLRELSSFEHGSGILSAGAP